MNSSISQMKAIAYSKNAELNISFWGWIISAPILLFISLIPAWLISQVALGWAEANDYFVVTGGQKAEPLVMAVIFAASFIGGAMVTAAGVLGWVLDDVPNALRGNTFATLRLAEKTGPATIEGE